MFLCQRHSTRENVRIEPNFTNFVRMPINYERRSTEGKYNEDVTRIASIFHFRNATRSHLKGRNCGLEEPHRRHRLCVEGAGEQGDEEWFRACCVLYASELQTVSQEAAFFGVCTFASGSRRSRSQKSKADERPMIVLFSKDSRSAVSMNAIFRQVGTSRAMRPWLFTLPTVASKPPYGLHPVQSDVRSCMAANLSVYVLFLSCQDPRPWFV